MGETGFPIFARRQDHVMTRPRPRQTPRGRETAAYNYVDEDGKLLYQVVRYVPKRFSFHRPDGRGGWIASLGNVRRVPYRLPELLAADPTEMVFVVEGEKDVNHMRGLGLVATCNSGGGGRGKWPRSHSRFLRGRLVVILADNDRTGREHARDVAQSLHRYAATVGVILRLPGVPEKGDVSDWIEYGGTAAGLLGLARECLDRPTAVPIPEPQFGTLDLDDMVRFDWTLRDILPDTELSAKEKLLLIIRRAGIRSPKLTRALLAQYLGLTSRRVGQMQASLRERGKLGPPQRPKPGK
jgi:5S rRNA maturation endonuclease (ribonuclease M5)